MASLEAITAETINAEISDVEITDAETTTTSPSTLLQMGTRDKSVEWYTPTLEKVSEVARDLLENYSHITPDRVIPHILEVRDRAWEIYPYPCIGLLSFIDLSLCRSPSYPLILKRIQEGASLLDLGCCCAQDLRKLVHDGAPSENLWGAELRGDFLELGYELFLDKETLKAHFMEADIFDMEGPLKELEGKMDFVNIGLFLHLFDLEGQVRACERIVSLMKPEKGSLILGRQIGSLEPGPMIPGSKMLRQSVESFEKMWEVVGERTGSEWKVSANVEGIDQVKGCSDDPNSSMLVFEVERIS